MVSRFQSRLDLVKNRMNSHNGELVTLQRGEEVTPGITVSPILIDPMEFNEAIPLTRVEYQVFAIDSTDYIFNSIEDVPKPGDTITRDSNSAVYQVTVMDSSVLYRYSTSTRNRLLILTNRITKGV